ncbi:MAG: SGNH/GDSL hydrolase family protein [Bryobacterales bacterium]|nr:SGNH/GDSL hydrolase family protein [Bryobacterales bacterium]
MFQITCYKRFGPRRGSRIFRIALATALFATAAVGQPTTRAEFAPVVDDPALPRVLIIGDSISIGYTLPLRAALDGIANVHRPPENCAHTWKGLESIDRWLGEGKWDLIHFNWGLHDLKYVDEEGKLALPPKGKQVSTLAEYAANLEKLVQRLNQTGATLIWRPTTPVPEGAQGRVPADLAKYNAAAMEVIDRHGIEVDDMNWFIKDRNVPHVRPDNVHFSKDSSALLAGNSAKLIRQKLKSD